MKAKKNHCLKVRHIANFTGKTAGKNPGETDPTTATTITVTHMTIWNR